MQRVAMAHPRASVFLISPHTAAQLLDEHVPFWRYALHKLGESQGATYFMGKQVLLVPGLRDGDFFPAYTSMPGDVWELTEDKETFRILES
jgi:hypothetical protein